MQSLDLLDSFGNFVLLAFPPYQQGGLGAECPRSVLPGADTAHHHR